MGGPPHHAQRGSRCRVRRFRSAPPLVVSSVSASRPAGTTRSSQRLADYLQTECITAAEGGAKSGLRKAGRARQGCPDGCASLHRLVDLDPHRTKAATRQQLHPPGMKTVENFAALSSQRLDPG